MFELDQGDNCNIRTEHFIIMVRKFGDGLHIEVFDKDTENQLGLFVMRKVIGE